MHQHTTTQSANGGLPRFYSQNGEDYFAWSVLGRPRSGFFVEVGAFNGVFVSGTYAFEMLGWRGICIEPHPRYFPLCKANRPNAACIHAACVGNGGPAEIEFFAESLGLYSGIGVDRASMEAKYASLGKEVSYEVVKVPARTLGAILEECNAPRVDVMTVDTEGSELEVLGSVDLDRYAPKVLIIEAMAGAEWGVKRAMRARGFTFLRRIGRVNLAFSSDPAVIEASRGFRIDCTLEAHVHPDGISSTGMRYRQPRSIRESASSQAIVEVKQTIRGLVRSTGLMRT